MKDAYGGILNLVFIAIFLVLVEGLLGFIVVYSKAFRMKNIVISSIEQYEGAGCFGTKSSKDTGCLKKIRDGAKSIGYSPTNLRCPTQDGFESADSLFCYKEMKEKKETNDYVYTYSVITQVDINIPILNNIMGLSFFQVNGDTRSISKRYK